ncbi:MAG: SDR family oxidoreductase [Bacteroidetes bacterium]|nr:SDR family oxidoreductase [Bacteroidota bacterium]MBS1685658.1 SDR family oxidoreductase [Bacteroidota bacterium]
MKRILLYGATGRTGRQVLDQALHRGYEVVALVRDSSRVTAKSSHLKVIQGDTTDLDTIRTAIQGCDAVISTLGALHQSEILRLGKIDPPHTLEQTMRATIQAMKEAGVRRVIVQTALGAGDSYPDVHWVMRLLIKWTHFKIVYDDHNMQEQLLSESELDWTFVRPVGLNDRDELHKLHVTLHKAPPTLHISRKHVARFMLDCLDKASYIREAPAISEE